MARRASRGSQRERLERLRQEAVAKAEASAKKTSGKKSAAKGRSTKPKAAKKAAGKQTGSGKVMVWGVFDSAYRQVASFPYKEKAEAEALCAKLTREKKKPHLVRPVKEDVG